MNDRQTILEPDSAPRLADSELLRRFADDRDEEAFGLLVGRHFDLVLGVCQRVLRNSHDAEDAFQATFLVLARDASRIRHRASLASWLYGVAWRTAVRASRRKRRRGEQTLCEEPMIKPDTLARVSSRHDQQLLDEELNRLPEKYREPLALRYLLGQSGKQIAERLGLSVSAVEGRLKRGKSELRVRLARRGVSIAVALASLETARAVASTATRETLTAAATQAGLDQAAGLAGESGTVSPEALELMAEEVTAMTMSKLLLITAIVALTLTTGFVGRGSRRQAAAQSSSPPAQSLRGAVGQAEARPAPPQVAQQNQDGGTAANEKAATIRERIIDNQRSASAATVVNYQERPPAEEKIEKALSEPARMEFIETPLQDVVEFLKDHHGIEIQLDRKALDNAAIGSDTPITRNIHGISFKNGLRLMLREMDLDTVIENEVLLITTTEVAESKMETRVYDLRSLQGIQPETLVATIQKCVTPEIWSETVVDGKAISPRAAVDSLAGGLLVVTHNQRGHEQVVDLLGQLLRATNTGGKSKGSAAH